jgi:ketosteroid isomerase-like protein
MSRILATNVFEHTGTEWRMVHHHASPVMRPVSGRGEADPEFLN